MATGLSELDKSESHFELPMKNPLEKLKKARKQLLLQFSSGEITQSFPEVNASLIDQYFRDSFQESQVGLALHRQKSPFAFVAVGGYGRRELCFHSDIDLLLLFGKKVPAQAKELVQEILFPLWDIGLDLGYGIQSLKECLDLVKNDFEVLTSVMDARLICGDSLLYQHLMEKLQEKILTKRVKEFNQWIIEHDKIRLERFGDSSYLLEPNLKEGIGGLRDYHHMLWLARVLFDLRKCRDLEFRGKLSLKEYQDLKIQVGFLWLVRNHLHQLSGRKNDRLGFEYQEKIAHKLGFQDQESFLAVEQFMGKLHATMANLKFLTRSFIIHYSPKKPNAKKTTQATTIAPGFLLDKGEIVFSSTKDISLNPFWLISLFEQSSRLDYPISWEANRLVHKFLPLIDNPFRESNQAVNAFLRIINHSKKSFEILEQMMEVGLLKAFIPEFGLIQDRVQFDTYHVYPVGIHALQTLRHLKNLPFEKDRFLKELFAELPHPGRLFLAGLFHDIGKIGKDHASRGAEITRNILKRFGLEEEVIEDISFLVRYHLLLVETANRRDLNDEKSVVQCARLIGDTKRLKMLYLLTWADSRATGPKAWNEWVANLIQELFFKLLHILKKGELATADASRKVEQVKSEVRQQIGRSLNLKDLEVCFEAMSPRYLLNTSAQEIVRHLKMVKHLKKKSKSHHSKEKSGPGSFILDTRKDEAGNCWEIIFIAPDRPGLFSKIAGIFALNNINILSAKIHTWRDGTAIDIFLVANPLDDLLVEEKWDKIRRDVKYVLTGKLSLDYRLGQKATSSILSPLRKSSPPPEVIVDNTSSDFFTIIEIFADDFIGLLYWITHTLFNLQLQIYLAKISTKVDQVVDVFYVRDLEGQKVEDKEHVDEIKKALLYQLKTP